MKKLRAERELLNKITRGEVRILQLLPETAADLHSGDILTLYHHENSINFDGEPNYVEVEIHLIVMRGKRAMVHFGTKLNNGVTLH